MKILSAFLLTLMLLLTSCNNSDSSKVSSERLETSKFLKVSFSAKKAHNTVISINQYVVITFSSSINAATVDASSVYIADKNNHSVAAELTTNSNRVSVIPNEYFLPNEQYTIVVTTTVEDINGRRLEDVFTFPFTTSSAPDTLPPSLISLTPADGTSADKSTYISMEFNETIANNGAMLEVRDSINNTIVNGASTISENTLRFVPDSDLIPGTGYTVTLQGTVEDLAGNAYTGQTSWVFSVIAVSDLSVVSVSNSGRVIRVEFSEYLNPLTVSESDFAINGGSITFKNLIIQDESTVKFIADSDINGTEDISVSGTIEDIYGNSHNNGVTAIYPLGWGI